MEWIPPTSYWTICWRGAKTHIDPEQAKEVAEQYKRGEFLIEFTDIFDSVCRIPRDGFEGMWESTTEERQRYDKHAKMLKAEQPSTLESDE